MDRIYVGAQELVLIDGGKVTERPPASPHVICDACGAVNGSAKRRCADCGRRLDDAGGATQEDPPGPPAAPHTWGVPDDTLTETTRDVIDGIAAKAIELGRFKEAERILLPHFDRLLERALSGQPLSKSEDHDPDVLLANATSNALALARGLNATRWIDWVFRIYAATELLMRPETIESLHALVRSHDYRNFDYVRSYLKSIEGRAGGWGSSERFLVRRLQGLMEVIVSRA